MPNHAIGPYVTEAASAYFRLRDNPDRHAMDRFQRIVRKAVEAAVRTERQRMASADLADVTAAAKQTSKWAVFTAGDGELAIRQRAEDEWVEAIVADVAPLIAAHATERHAADHPYVWVAPGRLGGKPCIGGHRLSVDQVTRIAVDGVDAVLTGWPYLTRAQVLVACWYQAVHGPRAWRRRWGAWADEHGDAMWSGNWDQVPDPTSSPRDTA